MANKKYRPRKISPIDSVVQRLLTSIDPDRTTEANLSERRNELTDIINEQLERAKGISDGSMVDFSRGLMNNQMGKDDPNSKSFKSGDLTNDLIDHINKNSTSIIQEFADNERNRYIEYRDYNFIKSFVPKVTQALRLILTHIVSSDDLSGQVSRIIEVSSAVSDDETKTLMEALKRYEEDTKLLSKLKNIVFQNALIMGTYYIYAVPYQKLFTEYNAVLEKRRKQNNITSKSSNDKKPKSHSSATESAIMFDDSEIRDLNTKLQSADIFERNTSVTTTTKEISDVFGDFSSVKIITSEVPFFIEDEGVVDKSTFDVATECVMDHNISTAIESAGAGYTTDATRDPNDKAFNVSGLYIKFISGRNVIPVEILGNIVGYFYMISSTVDKSKQSLSITNGNITSNRKQSPIQAIAASLTDKISKKFSDKFVAENAQFKQLIADCIIANGVTNTEYKIQFIPAEDMIPFNINEDENGHGRSILADAKYPAKTLAAISMRKSLNYINNSGDKTVVTMRSGNADLNNKNKAMRIIRNMQEQNVVASDIIGDFNSVFHKYSANGYILMPSSRSGQKLVELEKLEGQQVSMDVEWEKEKENETLISMGVPPLLIEQFQQADFAKSITSAHAGFAGIIINLQSDLEVPTTKLYKKIVETLDIPDNIKKSVKHSLKFRLPRPKYASVQTSMESLQNAIQYADTLNLLKYGDQIPEEYQDVAREAKFKIVRDRATCIDWNEVDETYKEKEAEFTKIKDDVKDEDAQLSTDDNDSDMGF